MAVKFFANRLDSHAQAFAIFNVLVYYWKVVMASRMFLDEDEALAVYASLDAPLYLDPDDEENIAFIADLQDDAHDLLADVLGFNAE